MRTKLNVPYNMRPHSCLAIKLRIFKTDPIKKPGPKLTVRIDKLSEDQKIVTLEIISSDTVTQNLIVSTRIVLKVEKANRKLTDCLSGC